MDKAVYKSVSDRADGLCENCTKWENLELHHILRRKVPATIDNCIMLCSECHRGTKGVHGKEGHRLDVRFKQGVQAIYLSQGKTENETRVLMGGRLY